LLEWPAYGAGGLVVLEPMVPAEPIIDAGETPLQAGFKNCRTFPRRRHL